MDERVFNFRNTNGAMTAIFCFFWPTAMFVGIVATRKNGQFIASGRPVAFNDLLPVFGVGVVLYLVGARILMGWLNERIEVDVAELRWFDWLGHLKLTHPWEDAVKYEDWGTNRQHFETSAGSLTFSNGISECALLMQSLREPEARSRLMQGLPHRLGPPSYVLPAKTYSYRWSYLHVVMTVWFCFVVLAAVLGVARSNTRSIGAGYALVLILFVSPGIWAQWVGWNERIVLGPEGITWFDFRGKVKLHSEPDQIVGVDNAGPNMGGGLRIYTTRGTVRTGPYVRNISDLKSEMQRLVDSRA